MDFSKLKNKLLIVLCVFVVLLPFYLITFSYGAEDENVEFDVIDNLTISSLQNYFSTETGRSVGYIKLDSNYIYTISAGFFKYLATSDSIPAPNVPYTYIGSVQANESYSFIPENDYLYFSFSTASNVTITRRPINGMSDSVSSLVDNVGINNLWNIFDISINYIVVVVLFAFGCYIIFRIIKKISRGKEGL